MAKNFQMPLRGRGALSLPDDRYSEFNREHLDDGWQQEDRQSRATSLIADNSKKIINYNDSPDVPFDRSINPYRGCEHGCVYCFARPTHAYLGLSPGLDFETQLTYKPNAAALLQQELAKRSYICKPITLGINTDAYQPIERRLGITREIIRVLHDAHHPFTVVTKSSLIERDVDLLSAMAKKRLVHVAVSVTTLNRQLSRHLEPRAATPQRRLQTIQRLRDVGIPVMVLVAPVIPVLTEYELEKILQAVRKAGALDAGYVLLRLPHETKELFEQWLTHYHPLKAKHVMNRIRDCRGGKLYDATYGKRMVGEGPYAELLSKRFSKMKAQLMFQGMPSLDCNEFNKPVLKGSQLTLF